MGEKTVNQILGGGGGAPVAPPSIKSATDEEGQNTWCM